MDTTEQYIKMRLAAIPDLGRGTPYLDTFCAMADLRSFVDRKGDFYVQTYEEPYYCQLERQDQLQKMVGIGKIHPPFLELQRWHDWAWETAPSHYYDSFTSMEQLWLAFVMCEKYNKVWDGETWLKRLPGI